MKQLFFGYLLLCLFTAASADPSGVGAFVSGPRTPDGTEVDCDLPGNLHIKNVGGSDGAGLCVFASMHHAGVWHGDAAFDAIFDWMRRHPGGGYPEKVDAMVKQLCQEKSLPTPEYLQVQGPESLDVLATALSRGHLVCVTYGKSPTGRYGGQRIAHMVNAVAGRAGPQKLWCVRDNNYPSADKLEWMTEAELRSAYVVGGGGWRIVLKKSPPPLVLKVQP